MYSIDWPAFFSALKDLALAGAAIVTAWVAVRGLQKWREELRGKTDFEIARGLARAMYKLRDELAACRAPLIRSAEYPPDYNPPAPGQPKNHAAEANALAHVYNNRWKPVTDALREFDAQRLEAEALWGPAIRKEAEPLHRCATTVFVAIESILDNARAGGTHFEADREFGRRTRSQAHAPSTATDNPLSNDVAAAVSAIEGTLSGHLKRPT
jgi:hypothetical protein